jgi:Dolichyl-phosphate-mannose-protein mannosyltransferase
MEPFPPIRDYFLRALTVFGVALAAITEFLSACGALTRSPLIVCWLIVIILSVLIARPRLRPQFSLTRDPVVLVSLAGIAVILALTGVTAAFSPPNSADAMAYHMPRVLYWAEQASVRFLPTPYFNQIMLQPLAEYAMLHTYLLSGGDHLINFVQWFASLASIVGVSAVAATLFFRARGQAIAALFCVTLPSGILASSGAKNDYWLAMWLVAAVYFGLRFTRTRRPVDAAFLGAALGLALLTKATAYLFIPWPLAAIFLLHRRSPRKPFVTGVLLAVAIALTLNAPQYARNYGLSGSVMGFDSAQGDGFFRWRNESFGWKQTASNVLRNLSEQLGARSPAWNERVYRLVADAHRRLGIDLNDPGTTWRWSRFAPPRNANHEADAPNRWHLALLLAIFCLLLWRCARGGEAERLLYAVALLCGFLTFCGYLKWQPYLARLLLPLFVLAAPLAGVLEEIPGKGILQFALCLFLLTNARLPATRNWVRPLKGASSVLHTPRDDQYFSDMGQWNNRESYRQAVDVISRADCRMVGIDITNLQLEYPLQALLRERVPGVRFVHTGVENLSRRYAPPAAGRVCAVACLDCAGDEKRTAIYGEFSSVVTVGKFVVFTR